MLYCRYRQRYVQSVLDQPPKKTFTLPFIEKGYYYGHFSRPFLFWHMCNVIRVQPEHKN
jgi:hypothetical protein